MRVLPLVALGSIVATLFVLTPGAVACDGVGIAHDGYGHAYVYACAGGQSAYESLPNGGVYCTKETGCVTPPDESVPLPTLP